MKKHASKIYSRGTQSVFKSGSPEEKVQMSPDSQIKWELEEMTRLEQGSSKVIATVDDYEADRTTDQKRVEQLLHDLEESFNELNVMPQEQIPVAVGEATQQPQPLISQTPHGCQFGPSSPPLPISGQPAHTSPGSQQSLDQKTPQLQVSSLPLNQSSSEAGYHHSPHCSQNSTQPSPQIDLSAFQPLISPQSHIAGTQQQDFVQPSQTSAPLLSHHLGPSQLHTARMVPQPLGHPNPPGQSQPLQNPFDVHYRPPGQEPSCAQPVFCPSVDISTTESSLIQPNGYPTPLSVLMGKSHNITNPSIQNSNSFGWSTLGFGQAQIGTNKKFVAPVGQDIIVKDRAMHNISTKHQCITVMKEYENKSLEELRAEDYLTGRKPMSAFYGCQGVVQPSFGFMYGPNQNTGFGLSAFPMGRLDLGLGTTIQFVPPVGQDTLVKYGVTHNINTKNQCITAMEAYKDKSLEELRLAYYLANRKVSSSKLYCDKCNCMENSKDLAHCCEEHLLCGSCMEEAAKILKWGRVYCPVSVCDREIPIGLVKKLLPDVRLFIERDEKWENGWIPCREPMEAINSKTYIAVTLDNKEPEYQSVSALFYHSMYKQKKGQYIRRVYRIQNRRLWEKYTLERSHMLEDLGEEHINERRLFHGTSVDVVPDICEEGIDWRLCGKNATRYGKGTYFARDASYSHSYVTPSGKNISLIPEHSIKQGSYLMFVVKVLVGRTFKGDGSVKRPPKNNSDKRSDQLHTAVDSTSNPSIYVVFEIAQSYPEYLIEYKLDKYLGE